MKSWKVKGCILRKLISLQGEGRGRGKIRGNEVGEGKKGRVAKKIYTLGRVSNGMIIIRVGINL